MWTSTLIDIEEIRIILSIWDITCELCAEPNVSLFLECKEHIFANLR